MASVATLTHLFSTGISVKPIVFIACRGAIVIAFVSLTFPPSLCITGSEPGPFRDNCLAIILRPTIPLFYPLLKEASSS